MHKIRTILSWKKILSALSVYAIMLLLFEACYFHVMGMLARGFVLGLIDFFATFVDENPLLCIKRIMMFAYCGALEIYGAGIAYWFCCKVNLRGVFALLLCLIVSIGCSFLIYPLITLVVNILKTAGFIVFIGFASLLLMCGGGGALLVISGLTDASARNEERAARIAVGMHWKKLR